VSVDVVVGEELEVVGLVATRGSGGATRGSGGVPIGESSGAGIFTFLVRGRRCHLRDWH
jgi:hypothetical protein